MESSKADACVVLAANEYHAAQCQDYHSTDLLIDYLYATICDVLIVVLKFGGITVHSCSMPRTVLQ